MIITSASVLASGDTSKTCWAGIRRFHNVSYVEEVICSLHKVPLKQKGNAKKQAEQIKYCLVQAKEYHDAAIAVSLATKPVLMYYSIMSLALAEILLKQDGNSSLDKARGQHAHHGLSFLLNSSNNQSDSLEKTASLLRATPLIKTGDERFGTFELWHRTSRELPILGQFSSLSHLGGTTTGYRILMGGEDKPLSKLPEDGITLLECLQYLPGMYSFIRGYGVRSFIVRGRMTANFAETTQRTTTMVTIHPYDADILERCYSEIMIAPSDIQSVNIVELESGVVLSFTNTDRERVSIRFPHASMWSKDEVRFFAPTHPLNEFGLFYVALYIAGNYARYYPDKWLADVDRATPLALAVEELLAQAEQRVPLLALSELTRNYLVPD